VNRGSLIRLPCLAIGTNNFNPSSRSQSRVVAVGEVLNFAWKFPPGPMFRPKQPSFQIFSVNKIPFNILFVNFHHPPEKYSKVSANTEPLRCISDKKGSFSQHQQAENKAPFPGSENNSSGPTSAPVQYWPISTVFMKCQGGPMQLGACLFYDGSYIKNISNVGQIHNSKLLRIIGNDGI
jgi:hypothetical protein